MKSRMNTRGNQADDKKYRPPCLKLGAWNGLIIHTDMPFPMKSTTGNKWTKFKTGIRGILETSLEGYGWVETSVIRSVAGLGVNVTVVYSCARVYLKGFFNAIEAWRWRGDRDLDGWRLCTIMDELAELEAIDAPGVEFNKGYPIAT